MFAAMVKFFVSSSEMVIAPVVWPLATFFTVMVAVVNVVEDAAPTVTGPKSSGPTGRVRTELSTPVAATSKVLVVTTVGVAAVSETAMVPGPMGPRVPAVCTVTFTVQDWPAASATLHPASAVKASVEEVTAKVLVAVSPTFVTTNGIALVEFSATSPKSTDEAPVSGTGVTVSFAGD